MVLPGVQLPAVGRHRCAGRGPRDVARDGGHTAQARATRVAGTDRWRTKRVLRDGETAYVERGDLRDEYGNVNDQRSAEVSG